jgi:hypothetical protein
MAVLAAKDEQAAGHGTTGVQGDDAVQYQGGCVDDIANPL